MLATLGILQSAKKISIRIAPLDTYTGSAIAYSLSKLRSAYTGSAIRVRRSSDNTEQDIGFDSNGNLDQNSLTTFIGNNSGFVTKIYDQSGNTGRDAIQTNSSYQPRIVNAGSIENSNGKPTINFLGTAYMNTDLSALNILNLSIFFIASENTEKNNAGIWIVKPSSGNDYDNASGIVVETGATTQYIALTQNLNGLVESGSGKTPNALRSIIKLQFNQYIYKNGSLNNSSTYNMSTSTSNTGWLLGTRFLSSSISTAYCLNGYIQEMIIYFSDQSSNRTGIESNINSYYSIY